MQAFFVPRVSWRLARFTVIAALAVPQFALADEPGAGYVVPPGREALLETMLCKGALPPGCACGAVKIAGGTVDAAYTCPDAPDAAVRLAHVSAGDAQSLKTTQFSISATSAKTPPALLTALAASVTAQEAGWQWVLAVPALPNAETATAEGVEAGWTPESRREFAEGAGLLRSGQREKALAVFLKLARETKKPRPSVLGHTVSALASLAPNEADVAKYAKEADAHPDDLLAQFLAGVSAHYCGHRNEPTRAAKLKMYEKAIVYLNRTLPAYADEPRVHIYLAVSHYRLGHQAEAEKEIEAAVALGDRDADAFYCRAEIWHKKDVNKALLDIKKYLSITEPEGTKRSDSLVSDTKQQRVHGMQETLSKLKPGEAVPEDLFDPIMVERPQAEGAATRWFAPSVIILAVIGGALIALWLQKRKAAA